MSRGVNKVFIVGNLGKDPDLRTTQAGAQIVNLNIATDESYRDRTSGQLVPKTEWHRVVIFGRTAEIAAQYLKKGSKVYLEGRLQTRKWQTQDGSDRYTTEIVVDISGQMQMLDGPGGNSSSDSSTTNFNHQPSGDTSGNLKNDGGPNCPPELDDFDVIPF